MRVLVFGFHHTSEDLLSIRSIKGEEASYRRIKPVFGVFFLFFYSVKTEAVKLKKKAKLVD